LEAIEPSLATRREMFFKGDSKVGWPTQPSFIPSKAVIFGVHRNSKGVLHATTRAVTSAGCFIDNHGSNELWTWITVTRKQLHAVMEFKIIVAIM
jgi:hypothetical protein